MTYGKEYKSAGEKLEHLNSLLKGRTIREVEFENLALFGEGNIRIIFTDGDTLNISPSAEFDGCGDFDEDRLWFELENTEGERVFDDYFS